MPDPAYGPMGQQWRERSFPALTPPSLLPLRLPNRHPTSSRPLNVRRSWMEQPMKKRLDILGHPEGFSYDASPSHTSWYNTMRIAGVCSKVRAYREKD